MSINVSTSMGFENREVLKSAAKEILQRSSADAQKANELVQKVLFGPEYTSSQQTVLQASTQITLNNSLKETLKYLQAHANDKRKKHVLGELWDLLGNVQNITNESSYSGELLDFEIDKNVKNIFAA